MGIKDRKEENRSDGHGETKPEKSDFDKGAAGSRQSHLSDQL